jgi:hypothetical protein
MGTVFEIFFLGAIAAGTIALVVHLLRRRSQLAVIGTAVRAQNARYQQVPGGAPADPAGPGVSGLGGERAAP